MTLTKSERTRKRLNKIAAKAGVDKRRKAANGGQEQAPLPAAADPTAAVAIADTAGLQQVDQLVVFAAQNLSHQLPDADHLPAQVEGQGQNVHGEQQQQQQQHTSTRGQDDIHMSQEAAEVQEQQQHQPQQQQQQQQNLDARVKSEQQDQVPAADGALLHSAGLKQLRSQWIRNDVSFEEELSGHIQRIQQREQELTGKLAAAEARAVAAEARATAAEACATAADAAVAALQQQLAARDRQLATVHAAVRETSALLQEPEAQGIIQQQQQQILAAAPARPAASSVGVASGDAGLPCGMSAAALRAPCLVVKQEH